MSSNFALSLKTRSSGHRILPIYAPSHCPEDLEFRSNVFECRSLPSFLLV